MDLDSEVGQNLAVRRVFSAASQALQERGQLCRNDGTTKDGLVADWAGPSGGCFGLLASSFVLMD